jgi:predicted Zn-dependent peptidase
MQSPASIARLAAIDVLFGLPVDHHREMAGIFQALSAEEVQTAAANLLATPPVTVRVLPSA